MPDHWTWLTVPPGPPVKVQPEAMWLAATTPLGLIAVESILMLPKWRRGRSSTRRHKETDDRSERANACHLHLSAHGGDTAGRGCAVASQRRSRSTKWSRRQRLPSGSRPAVRSAEEPGKNATFQDLLMKNQSARTSTHLAADLCSVIQPLGQQDDCCPSATSNLAASGRWLSSGSAQLDYFRLRQA